MDLSYDGYDGYNLMDITMPGSNIYLDQILDKGSEIHLNNGLIIMDL